MPQLIIKWGTQAHHFEINTPKINIGRSDDNQLQLRDVKISRYQCQITKTPLGYLLSDSDSSNGTFLNGKRIERNILHNSDVVKIGNVQMTFLENGTVQSNDKVKASEQLVISPGPASDDVDVGQATTVIKIEEISNDVQAIEDAKPQSSIVVVAKIISQPSRTPVSPAPVLPVQKTAVTPLPKAPAPVAFKKTAAPMIEKPQPVPVMPNPADAEEIPITEPKLRPAVNPHLPTMTGKGKKAKIPIRKKTVKTAAIGPRDNDQEEEHADQSDNVQEPAAPPKKKMVFMIGGAAAIILLAFLISLPFSAAKKEKREKAILTQANSLYKEKQYSEAQKKFKEFEAEFPSSKYIKDVKTAIKDIQAELDKKK